jgi:alpha-N-arabinofuranosidase
VEPGAFQWNPNLIGYDSLHSYVSPSYYAQQMFQHRGDRVVPAAMTAEPANFFHSATRSRATGTVCLKFVNLNATAQTVQIEINGSGKVAAAGSLTVLTSARPSDTNTINDPARVKPVTTRISGLGARFTRTFEPYSLSVLELQAR